MNKLYNDTAVQAIANAIRAKNGSTDTYTIAEMSTALNDLSYYAKPTISNIPLATFEADGLPLNSLKVSVVAKQEGSGTPSPENVRPISGWSEVVVSDVGNDIWTGDDTYTSVSTGYIIPSTTISLPIGTYAFEFDCSNPNGLMQFEVFKNNSQQGANRIYNSDGFSVSTHNRVKFTINEAGTNLRLYSNNSSGISISNVRLYSTVVTTTISLGQTVYGGELDVVNGILKITDGYIASYNGETLPSTWISSMDAYAEGTTPTTGAEVCYELAEPIINNLTPNLIKSLNGTNNLSVDCGDVIELEYFKEV